MELPSRTTRTNAEIASEIVSETQRALGHAKSLALEHSEHPSSSLLLEALENIKGLRREQSDSLRSEYYRHNLGSDAHETL